MLCEICNEKEATVHLKKMVNDKVEKLHMCEECAMKKGFSPFKEPSKMTISELLSCISNITQPPETDTDTITKCERCGYTFSDFQKVGKLGCPDCFIHFRKEIIPLLRNIHGATKHSGKIPPQEGHFLELQDKINQLKKEMHKAASEEKYEEAAKIRDTIYQLEKELANTTPQGKDDNAK